MCHCSLSLCRPPPLQLSSPGGDGGSSLCSNYSLMDLSQPSVGSLPSTAGDSLGGHMTASVASLPSMTGFTTGQVAADAHANNVAQGMAGAGAGGLRCGPYASMPLCLYAL